MKTQNQSGFAVVEALLILVILAIVGGTGYFVWHSKQATDTTLSDTANSQPALAKKASKAAESSSNSTSTTQYLTIKEWGVRLKLTSATSSLYYYIGSDKPDVAYFSFKTIDKVAPNCAANDISLAAISRMTQAQQDEYTKSPSDTGIPGTIHVGSYWYGYEHSHADCTDGTDTMRNAVTAAQPDSDIQTIFNTLEAAN